MQAHVLNVFVSGFLRSVWGNISIEEESSMHVHTIFTYGPEEDILTSIIFGSNLFCTNIRTMCNERFLKVQYAKLGKLN